MQRLLASLQAIWIKVGDDGNVSEWNRGAEEAFAVAASSVVGKPFLDCPLDWNWSEILQMIEHCRGRAEALPVGDRRVRRHGGPERIVTLTCIDIGGTVTSGPPADFIIIGFDVTEQRATEAQLIAARKVEAIGLLAAGVAHELNTPTQYVGDNLRFIKDSMATILKYARPAPGDSLGSKDIEEFEYLCKEIPTALQQSLDGVEHIANIVRAMKDFSHPGSGQPEYTDINRSIQNTVTIARNEWKTVCDVKLMLDAELPRVCCVGQEINQVFLNIIVNAAQAIGDVAKGAAGQKGIITITTKREGDFVKISIRDTGPGIPEAIRNKIFDPFFTTKKIGLGTGQGLPLARTTIVERHGGSLDFETAVGAGTVFHILLPIDGKTPEPA